MVAASDIGSNEIILEIGPGKGILTERLVKISKKVIAVELDRRLEPYLKKITSNYDNLEIIWGNVLDMKFPRIDKIVSNLPFSITEPFISRLFNEGFKSATLLVGETYGKEASSENPKTRLALLTNAYFRVEYIQDVPSAVFDPEPATDGSIINLYKIKKQDLKNDFKNYIIRCLWDQKTRPLRDALSAAVSQYIVDRGGNTVSTAPFVAQIVKHYNHSLLDRVDKITSTDFVDLYQALEGINIKKAFNGHKPRGGSTNWRKDYEQYI